MGFPQDDEPDQPLIDELRAAGFHAAERRFNIVEMLRRVEAYCGLLYACLLAVVLAAHGLTRIVDAVFYSHTDLSLHAKVGLFAGWAVFAVLEFATMIWIGRMLQMKLHPLAVHMAMRQRFANPLVRIGAATWWLGHAALVVILTEFVLAERLARSVGGGNAWVGMSLQLGVIFLLTFVSNTFFVVAVAALWPRQTVVLAVWRHRLLIDLALTFALIPLLSIRL